MVTHLGVRSFRAGAVEQGRLTHHIIGERSLGRGIGSELRELLPHRRLHVAELGLGGLGGCFHDVALSSVAGRVVLVRVG